MPTNAATAARHSLILGAAAALSLAACADLGADTDVDEAAGVASTNGSASPTASVSPTASTRSTGSASPTASPAPTAWLAPTGCRRRTGSRSRTACPASNGLMTTDAGRKTVAYLVKCALGGERHAGQAGPVRHVVHLPGRAGTLPAWKNGGVHGPNFRTCQNLVSACMMAHVNTAGVHIPIWMASEAPQIGWGVDLVNYPKQEGTFFGNIMETGDLSALDMPGVTGPVAYYCEGAGFAAGTVQVGSARARPAPTCRTRTRTAARATATATIAGHWSTGSSSGQPADGYKRATVNGYCSRTANRSPSGATRTPRPADRRARRSRSARRTPTG